MIALKIQVYSTALYFEDIAACVMTTMDRHEVLNTSYTTRWD